jgi:hypothetical protein
MSIRDTFNNMMKNSENAFPRGEKDNIPHGDISFPRWNPFGDGKQKGGRRE